MVRMKQWGLWEVVKCILTYSHGQYAGSEVDSSSLPQEQYVINRIGLGLTPRSRRPVDTAKRLVLLLFYESAGWTRRFTGLMVSDNCLDITMMLQERRRKWCAP